MMQRAGDDPQSHVFARPLRPRHRVPHRHCSSPRQPRGAVGVTAHDQSGQSQDYSKATVWVVAGFCGAISRSAVRASRSILRSSTCSSSNRCLSTSARTR